MNFSIERSLEILERTPDVLHALLDNLSSEWTAHNEGDNTWNVVDVVAHLIHGEKTDWIPRTEIMLSDNDDKNFEPFDMFAHFEDSNRKTLDALLFEFSSLRKSSIQKLKQLNISLGDLEQVGVHPAFGEVKLEQHLATWTVHDLNHISQITRIMAKRYLDDVGPWRAYLGILK